MCTYATVKTELDGSAKGPNSVVPRHRRHGVLRPSRARDGRAHAQHRLRRPAKGPAARVAVELTAASARELVSAIEAALASAPEALTV